MGQVWTKDAVGETASLQEKSPLIGLNLGAFHFLIKLPVSLSSTKKSGGEGRGEVVPLSLTLSPLARGEGTKIG
jgi:hypothetical protein